MGVSTGARRLAAVLLAGTALVVPALSASAQTLVETFVSTYNSNSDLLAQRARLRVVDESVSQAISLWRPTIRATGDLGIGRIDSNLRRPERNDLWPRSYQITLSQPLFRGGKTLAQMRGAEADVLAERATLHDREQFALLSAVTSYSDVVRDTATVELRRNNVRVLDTQLAATNARFRVGELTRTDVAQSESRVARSQSDLIAAEASVANSRATYHRVVGRPVAAALVDAPLIGEVPPTEENAVALAQEYAPRVVAARHRLSSANHAIDNAKGDLLPQASLDATARRAFDSTVADDRTRTYQVKATLTVPLYQGGGEHSRVRQAKQNYGQRQIELDGARRQSAEAAIRAFRAFEAAKARVTSIDAQVRAAQVALDGVRQEAQVGSRTTLDVLNAEQELLDAQVQLVAARRDMVIGHYQLQAEVGQLTARQLKLPVEFYDEERYYKNVRDAWFGLGP